MSPLRRFGRLCWNVYWRFVADDGDALSGYMAFSAFLALFPFLIFVTVLATMATGAGTADDLVRYVFDLLPADVGNALEPAAAERTQARGGALTLSLIGTLWVASNGVEALRIALNRAYGQEETRYFHTRRLQSMLIVIAGALILMALTPLIVLGPSLSNLVLSYAPQAIEDLPLWNILRYIVGGLLLIAGVYAAHELLPSRDPEAPIWPGVIFTTAAWLASASLFSLYITYIPSYTFTYGALGGLIASLVFFYLSAVIVILGAELNAELAGLDADPEAERRLAAHGHDSHLEQAHSEEESPYGQP